MAHWYYLRNTIVIAIKSCNAKKMIRSLMFIISNHYGIKCLSNLLQLEPCIVMFKVISDELAHLYDMWNTIVITINFCNGKKMICALMFIICNHDGIKYLSNLLQLEPWYVMFKVMSDIMAHWNDLWNVIFIMQWKWFVHWCLSKRIME